ncbi:hypothetical protein OHD16_21505 [Sphingobacterium sp. ML3W]|uniref:hypothetical protein n=1 Tax=Sphingobacterium sp. ML3W TaxID=1538644 RepID=UPI00249CB738|nr:hypothetical protein [Sphingobacterium sp. ML3W]WFA77309.1 hypothetical protein OGI71_14645 [Sphingobacterium sp. ML3W]
MTNIEVKCQLYHNEKFDGCLILEILAFECQIEILKGDLSDNEEKLRIGVYLDCQGGLVEDGFRLSQIIVRLSQMYSLNAEYTIVSNYYNDSSLLKFPTWGRNRLNVDVGIFNRIALASNTIVQLKKKVAKRDFKQEKLRTKFHRRNFKR